MVTIRAPRFTPVDKGICQVWLVKSSSRPPLEHAIFVPVSSEDVDGLYYDVDEIFCTCEGFAYNNGECWHVEWVLMNGGLIYNEEEE